MQHLVDTDQLSLDQIEQIIKNTKEFKQKKPPLLLQDKVIVTLFFEKSTRTRSSFEIAGKRMGAAMVLFDPSKSSTSKGETLKDTFATLCAMEPDAVIVRHAENSTPQMLADMDVAPVINAGAGNYAHPTQALLDYFTIHEHFNGNIKGKMVTIVGDIANSRVASSSIRLFKRMGMKISLVAPPQFMPDVDLQKHTSIDDIINDTDIIISLRAQLERHKMPYFKDYSDYAREYCITKDLMKDKDILLMHPGPVMRNIDISDDMLDDPRCKILQQVKNSVYTRMAILKLLLLDC